jgi:hypothetical protein
MRGMVPTALLAAVLAAACGHAEGDPRVQPSPVWQVVEVEDTVALLAQPELQAYRDRLDPELGHSPGSTPWQPFDGDLPGGVMEATHASASEALQEVAGALGWEATPGVAEEPVTTSRLLVQGTTATGMLLRWGLPDDSLAGEDLRVRMRRDDGGWRIEQLQVRYHCRRGVTDDGLCI